MTIIEWFARAVAAGVLPFDDIVNIEAIGHLDRIDLWLTNRFHDYRLPVYNVDLFTGTIQLRKDGKDLYSLEWRKPTEQDLGKMCWFYSNRNHKDKTVYCAELFEFQNEFNVMGTKFIYHLAGEYARHEKYCLLADHNRIVPTEADFIKVYGE